MPLKHIIRQRGQYPSTQGMGSARQRLLRMLVRHDSVIAEHFLHVARDHRRQQDGGTAGRMRF